MIVAINYDEAIRQTRDILKEYSTYPDFQEYSKGYLFSTEYISRYLHEIPESATRALTVLSSGDHVFNLVSHGITNIDAFDINTLSYFTFWLKFAFILNLSYNQFIRLPKIIRKASAMATFFRYIEASKKDMPEDVYNYFWEAIRIASSLGVSNGLFNLYLPAYSSLKPSNQYLKNEQEFMRLKSALRLLDINFYFGDAREIPDMLTGNYGAILLSNITDYLGSVGDELTIAKFREYINSFAKFLDDPGVIISYLYGLNSQELILDSTITLEQLGHENVRRLTRFSGEGYYVYRRGY